MRELHRGPGVKQSAQLAIQRPICRASQYGTPYAYIPGHERNAQRNGEQNDKRNQNHQHPERGSP